MRLKNRVFLNEKNPPKDTLERRFLDSLDAIESPLAGTNIGKQFGLGRKQTLQKRKTVKRQK